MTKLPKIEPPTLPADVDHDPWAPWTFVNDSAVTLHVGKVAVAPGASYTLAMRPARRGGKPGEPSPE